MNIPLNIRRPNKKDERKEKEKRVKSKTGKLGKIKNYNQNVRN